MGKYTYFIFCGCQYPCGLLLKVFVTLLIKSSGEAVVPCHARCDAASITCCQHADGQQTEMSWSYSHSMLLPELGTICPSCFKVISAWIYEASKVLHDLVTGNAYGQTLRWTGLLICCVCTNKQQGMVRSWAAFNFLRYCAWGMMKVAVWAACCWSECPALDHLLQEQKRHKGWDCFAFINILKCF